jgi:hypothetical protein
MRQKKTLRNPWFEGEEEINYKRNGKRRRRTNGREREEQDTDRERRRRTNGRERRTT